MTDRHFALAETLREICSASFRSCAAPEFRKPAGGSIRPSLVAPLAPALDCENPDCWSPKGAGIRRELTLESGASMILTACSKCAHLIEGDPDVARVVVL